MRSRAIMWADFVHGFSMWLKSHNVATIVAFQYLGL